MLSSLWMTLCNQKCSDKLIKNGSRVSYSKCFCSMTYSVLSHSLTGSSGQPRQANRTVFFYSHFQGRTLKFNEWFLIIFKPQTFLEKLLKVKDSSCIKMNTKKKKKK